MNDRENEAAPSESPSQPPAPATDAPAGVSASSANENGAEAPSPVVPRRSRPPAAAEPAPLTAPVVDVAPLSPPQPARRRGITVEAGIYLCLIGIAILSRFWHLGAKALHHDESLHAYYSWVYATGGGYRHHPLMHGPFLFHANALVYLLVGATNATSRYMPAIFGVAIVAMPYLLRGKQHLGRWGALSASFLLLISPTIGYQSRYIRHDVYTVAGTLLLFTAIVRYIDKPERRWLVIGAASIAFLLTNHEIIFAILFIFFAYLYGALLWGCLRAWWPDRRPLAYRLIGLHAGAVVLLLWLRIAVPKSTRDRILDIPWSNPTNHEQIQYYKDALTNPFVLGVLGIGIAFLVGLWSILRMARNPEVESGSLPDAVLGSEPEGSVGFSVRAAWSDRAGLAIATLVAVVIFITFYTSIFTNMYGLVSSTIATDGTLLYWLGQHDYRRGDQPWFYFLLLLPQYEFIGVLLGGAMAALTFGRALGAVTGLWSGGRNLFFRLFLATWAILIFLGLSYAGEKMPWLVVHISLPLMLLAAALLGGMIERGVAGIRARREQGRFAPGAIAWPEWALIATMLACTGAWFVLAGRLTYGSFEGSGGQTRAMTKYAADRWWWLAVPPLVAVACLAGATLLRGTRRTGFATLVTMTAVLGLLQIHGGMRLAFTNPDIPVEMMVYTQTSPDVTRVMSEIDALSEDVTGGRDLVVWYDDHTSWPFQWYLRDYPNKRFFGAAFSEPPKDAAVVLIATDRDAKVAPLLSGYTATEYVLRWWFPEELYRDFAIAPELDAGKSAWKSVEDPHGPLDILGSIFDSLHTLVEPEGQMHLYRLVMYRELERPLGQYNFKMYVRNDLLPLLNDIRY